MLSRLEKVEFGELQDRMVRHLYKMSNDHSLPYQTRKDIAEVVATLKGPFEEIEDIVKVKERLLEITQDKHGLLTTDQRSQVYDAATWIEDFVRETLSKRG